ncbi:MAG: hypothetical protein L0177_03945 [Chloroflexi bacterium]|nr:hypothetical protein [Chloroflexota bacterium]
MEKSNAAESIIERFQGLLFRDLSRDEASRARAGILKWLEASIEGYQDKPRDDQERQIEVYIPNEIREEYGGLGKRDRFEAAATAFERWRLRALSSRALNRAQAVLEGSEDLPSLKREAEADLQEIQAIERSLSASFPGIYKSNQSIISESKLDCLYVMKGDTGITSRRLGRLIEASAPSEDPRR